MIDLYNYVPGTFLSICLASGFSYTTYSLAFTLMNGYIPLVTDLSKSDVIQINSYLLVVDMLALPIFGYISQKIGKERLMSGAALCAAMGALPVFYLLSSANLVTVILVRLFIVLCGVAFAAPYYAWAMDQVKPEHRYTVLAISGCIGSQLIGAPTAAISLWLFKITNWAPAPSLYLTLVGLSGLYSIRRALLQKSIFSNCPS
jgi:MFS family permease